MRPIIPKDLSYTCFRANCPRNVRYPSFAFSPLLPPPLPTASLHPYVSMMVGRSMSHVWLRMSDDFWLHLRPSVKFRACHVAPRVMHRPPTPDTKFRHLYMIDIRLIAVDRLRVPRFGHRPGSFSPSFSLPLPLPLSSLSSTSFFFVLNSPLYRKYRSRLFRGCVGAAGLHVRCRVANPDVTTSLSSHATYPTPSPFFQPVLRVFARHHET